MTRLLTTLLLLAACGGTEATPEPAPEPEPAPAPAPEPAPKATPQSLYEECGDRVEKPQAADECTTDDDCAKGGASLEVCTTTAGAADLMTTAEVKACFAVLDACGCHEGQCTWTLKDEVPAGGGNRRRGKAKPNGKPGMLPPTGSGGQ
ncbi:MAG: eight-cysteine-cluster-containing protein [Myxococcota bacterium]|jgi:eight-cysteine-cluster-containing protein